VDPVRAIADAVLYEGYVLWPYRRSALKNQRRWTFGGVYPRAHSEGRDDDPWTMRTECLLEGDEATRVDVRVRFLHVVERQVLRLERHALEPVDELTVGGARHLTWSEAVEREIGADELSPAELAAAREPAAAEPAAAEAAAAEAAARLEIPIAIEAGCADEVVRDESGRPAGALRRSWSGLDGAIEIGATRLRERLFRLSVTVSNTTPFAGGGRERALERTFCSTHTVLRARHGEFVSLTDPPAELAGDARACRNEGAWPVLVGEEGERHTLLSSPIILEDHPRIAPESPGDLFDGGEIDQMLVLNILTLTEEEKAEMRATDPRTREILERTEALTPDELMKLHGAIREYGLARRP
jgi:hypothetical protein